MALNQLTDAKIRNTKPPKGGEVMLADGGGLYLILRPDGSRYWQFQYRYDGRKRKRGLGAYPAVKLAAARAAAEECRAQLARDVSPVEAAERARAERMAAAQREAGRPTVRALFIDWRKNRLAGRKDGGAGVLRAFEKDVFPRIGDRRADEVTRREMVALLDRVKARGVGRMANVLLSELRQMFTYAVVSEAVKADPTYGIRKKDVGGAETMRDRVLSADEIRELAEKLPESGVAPEIQSAAWILLATCARVGELTRSRWEEVDFEARTWHIPAENSKNGLAQIIQLSDFALRHLGELPSRGKSEWLYPARDCLGPLNRQAIQKFFRDRQRPVALPGRSVNIGALQLAGGEWTAHDLRRTGATLMGELGVRPDVIDRCLNHVETRRVTRTYQRQELMEERCRAFDLLGGRLNSILIAEPGKVAMFRKATKS